MDAMNQKIVDFLKEINFTSINGIKVREVDDADCGEISISGVFKNGDESSLAKDLLNPRAAESAKLFTFGRK